MEESEKKTEEENHKKILSREQEKQNPKFSNNSLYLDTQMHNICKIVSLLNGNPEHSDLHNSER